MKIERLTRFWKTIIGTSTIIGILMSINMIFRLKLFGFNPIETSYLFYLLACFLPISFIIMPLNNNKITKVKFYDVILFISSISILIYLGINGTRIILEGWDWNAPMVPTVLSVILWAIVLEALRRAGGTIIAVICLIFSFFPLVTMKMPISFLQGQSFDFLTIARNHVMSSNSIIGIPFTTVGNLVLGFLIFGVVLTFTGGGEFFFKFAQSLFGKARGGEAKVAIVGSSLFGMLSGSAISNTITTGAMTIPAMKKSGYKPHYAAAIEATASTGGSITPPIMGSAAFIMAHFLGVPYIDIVLAAVIPAVLYYISLFIQTDGYAAKNNLKGLSKEELPKIGETLKEGWPYLISLFILLYFLAVLKSEGQAPYYASAVLIIVAMIKKSTRMKKKDFIEMTMSMSKLLTEIICILAGVGLIVGALSVTGVSFSFSRELIAMSGGNVFLILVAGAITSFVLGMGMTVSAVYVFLAVVLAPALISSGVDPIGAHLFVIYWATASYITPPVALAAFAAAGIAGSNALKTGFTAVRLGIVTFFIPFFFVYQPALLGNGEVIEVILSVGSAIVGVIVLASALEGYLITYGSINNWLIRGTFFAAGLLMFAPNYLTDFIGLCVIFILLTTQKMHQKKYEELSKVN